MILNDDDNLRTENSNGTAQRLGNQIETFDTDLVCQMLKVIAEFPMGLDADQHGGSAFGQCVSPTGNPKRVHTLYSGLLETLLRSGSVQAYLKIIFRISKSRSWDKLPDP